MTELLTTRDIGGDIGGRIDGLAQAADAAEGRLDPALVAEARTVIERASGRLKLSADHTVVAIAGATGSGKSSTFNALTGLDLSAVGVRRPTTSWATACVWGADGARELLGYLGIPERHQTTRDSMLDTRRESNELEGVVLLDLPDHDSTEVSHHLEVDRLVVLADLVVWVVDPQKYADAAIHDRYLEPLKTHAEVMIVVLNHIDAVPEERREGMVADLRRLLDNDGLAQVPIFAVSAKLGWGMAELKTEIAQRVADKKMTRARLEADIETVARRISEASGTATATTLPTSRVEALDDAVAESAGVPTIVEAVQRATRLRAGRATGWPVVSWVSLLRPDPLKRLHLELGPVATSLTGSPRTSLPEATAVQRARVDAEVRSLADDASTGLGEPWAEAIRAASVSRTGDLADRLDAALGRVDLDAARLPWWAGLIRALQWLLLLGALAGAGWTIAAAVSGGLGDTGKVAGVAVPLVLLIGCVVGGLVLAILGRALVAGASRSRAQQADARLRGAVSEVTRELVVSPIEAELARHGRVREGIGRALR